jgi:hypothetical protein
VNDLKNRLKYGYVFPKANELKNRFIHRWRTKIPIKTFSIFIIVEIEKWVSWVSCLHPDRLPWREGTISDATRRHANKLMEGCSFVVVVACCFYEEGAMHVEARRSAARRDGSMTGRVISRLRMHRPRRALGQCCTLCWWSRCSIWDRRDIAGNAWHVFLHEGGEAARICMARNVVKLSVPRRSIPLFHYQLSRRTYMTRNVFVLVSYIKELIRKLVWLKGQTLINWSHLYSTSEVVLILVLTYF